MAFSPSRDSSSHACPGVCLEQREHLLRGRRLAEQLSLHYVPAQLAQEFRPACRPSALSLQGRRACEGSAHPSPQEVKVVLDSNVLLSGWMSPEGTPILATLIASGADVLVSGDRDLLELRGKYPIQSPAEFVRRL
jgi:hypothetical protein